MAHGDRRGTEGGGWGRTAGRAGAPGARRDRKWQDSPRSPAGMPGLLEDGALVTC